MTFTLLLHTFRVFNASFPPNFSSAVVKWAKLRVDEFNESLERQLSSVERGSELWVECVGIVKSNAKVLSEVAVDFSGIVGRGLDEGEPSAQMQLSPQQVQPQVQPQTQTLLRTPGGPAASRGVSSEGRSRERRTPGGPR